MILKNLLSDKRGIIEKGLIWMVVVLALFLLIIVPNYASAGKTDQYSKGNLTCENMTDTMLWTALAAPNAAVNVYFNWTIGTPCPGVKSCDVHSLEAYVRIMNVGKAEAAAGAATAQIGNKTQSPVSTWTGIRYFAYSPVLAAGAESGPLWTCGDTASPNVCNVSGQGFDNSTTNYSVRLYAEGANNARRMLVDVFNMKYPWCWTPLIYDANVSIGSAVYTNAFNFTINVTNPGTVNTTVWLLTRTIGGTWEQEGNPQYCFNCAQRKLGFPVTFTSGEIGDREFKFNATDNAGYSMEASASSTTNECLDFENDCVFTIEDEVVTSGTPVLADEKVNGVTSGATEGWGSNWTFSAKVNNPADGVGNINLTLLLDTGSGFVNKGSQICSSPCLLHFILMISRAQICPLHSIDLMLQIQMDPQQQLNPSLLRQMI